MINKERFDSSDTKRWSSNSQVREGNASNNESRQEEDQENDEKPDHQNRTRITQSSRRVEHNGHGDYI